MTDLAHDYLDLDSLLSAEEIELRGRVRAFVRVRCPRTGNPLR